MTRSRDTADQINRINSSAANATAITVDSSENVSLTGALNVTGAVTADGLTVDGNATLQNILNIGGSDPQIRTDTSDGSDNKTLWMGGGGVAYSWDRGGYLYAQGNEAGGHVGISAGNVSGGSIKFNTGAAERMQISAAGELITKGGISIDSATEAGPELSRERGQNLKLKGQSGTDAGITAYNAAGNHAFQIYGNPSETGGPGDGAYGFLDGNWAGWDIKKYKNGNLFLNNSSTHGLAGDGILLGGTGSANKLTDYERGIFSLSLGGKSGGPFGSGKYVRIGSLVHFQWYSNGAMTITSATASFTGLPFTTAPSPYYSVFYAYHNTYVTNSSGGYLDVNATSGVFTLNNATGGAAASTGAGKYLMLAGSYYTD